MKKIKLALALLPLVCLTGCNKEETWRNDANKITIYSKGNTTPMATYKNMGSYVVSYIICSTDAIKIRENDLIIYFSNVSYTIEYWR